MRSPAQRGSLAALLWRAASQQQQQLIQGQLGAAVAVVPQSLPSGLSPPPGSNAVASSSRCYSSTGTASASAGGLRRSVSQPALPPSAAAAAAAAAARASLLSHCQVGTSLLGLQQLAAGGARGYAGMARGGRRGPRQPPVPEGPPAPKRNQEITVCTPHFDHSGVGSGVPAPHDAAVMQLAQRSVGGQSMVLLHVHQTGSRAEGWRFAVTPKWCLCWVRLPAAGEGGAGAVSC